jgi:hypothetical protein
MFAPITPKGLGSHWHAAHIKNKYEVAALLCHSGRLGLRYLRIVVVTLTSGGQAFASLLLPLLKVKGTLMKQLGIAMLLVLGLMLGACGGGSSSNSNNINGNWTAALSDATGAPAFAFTTSLIQNSGTVVSVTNLSFTTATPCFASGGSGTGLFILSGNFNGNVTGTFQLTIQSGTPSSNVFTLQGTVKNNTISGTWTLTGVTSGCSGSGNFTMTKM